MTNCIQIFEICSLSRKYSILTGRKLFYNSIDTQNIRIHCFSIVLNVGHESIPYHEMRNSTINLATSVIGCENI